MSEFCNGVVTLAVDTLSQTGSLPKAADLAGVLAAQLPAATIEAISDLYAAGFCAKPLFFDGLFSADPAQRSLLKQVKAAKYMELSLLQSVCTEKGRHLMGAAGAEEALLHLLAKGSVRLCSGHLQTAPGKLPMEASVDPRLEKPMVVSLQGDFHLYLRATEAAFSALQEKGSLEVCGVCFRIVGWQPLVQEAGTVACLQAAAAVTEATHMDGEASRFRLSCSGGRQYITAGSLVSPGDEPGSVLYEKSGNCRMKAYTLSVSF